MSEELNTLDTLPKWSEKLAFSLDRARELVRAREDLKRLGLRVGAARLFTRAEAEQIAAAVAARRAAREAATALASST